MFNLVPWNKKSNSLTTRHDQEADSFALTGFRQEFDELWERFIGDFGRNLRRWDDDFGIGFQDGWDDKGSEYVFQAAVPGYDSDQIDVTISGNTLSVKAERSEDKKEKNGERHRYGVYHRYFTLPADVDDANVEASYRNGVLEVHLPKSKQSTAQRITVQNAK